jgi:hypothetical protein
MADGARHPDAVDLAEYAEGLLEASDQQAVEDHVRDCPDCSTVLTDLATVPDVLAQAPIPPMPDDVAARLDHAIATEAAARASEWSGAAAQVTPIRRPRRWLAPLAAAAAVIAAIAIAIPTINTSDNSAQDAGSSDSASEPLDSGADVEAPAGEAQAERVALTTEHFGRDVIDAYYSGSDAVRVDRPVSAIAAGTYREAAESVPGLCDLDAGSSVPRGEVDAITLDGEPAQLLRRDQGRAVDVIAFLCDDKGPHVLDAVTLRRR